MYVLVCTCRQRTAFLLLLRKLGLIVLSFTVADAMQMACAAVVLAALMLAVLVKTHPISPANGRGALLLSQLTGLLLPVGVLTPCSDVVMLCL